MAEEGQQIDGQQNGADWRPHAETLRSDPELAPHLDKISEKTVTDLVKSHVHLSRKLGNSVQMPDPAKAKPEEIKAFKDSVYKAGLFESAPESPDKYTLNRPDGIPETAWPDELVGGFKAMAHELGLTQKQVDKLAEFDAKRFSSFAAPLAADLDAAKKAVTEQWAKEGKGYDEMMALAVEGMAKRNFTAEEVQALEKIGALSHPAVLSGLAKIGEAFKDSDGVIGADTSRIDSALADFQPGGAKWEKLAAGDPATLAERDAIYSKKYPGMVNLS